MGHKSCITDNFLLILHHIKRSNYIVSFTFLTLETLLKGELADSTTEMQRQIFQTFSNRNDNGKNNKRGNQHGIPRDFICIKELAPGQSGRISSICEQAPDNCKKIQ